MQKRILAGLPLLAGALIFFGLWITHKLTTPPWKSELNQYIDFKASPPNPLITVQRTIQASKPWKFTKEMGVWMEFQSTAPLPFPPDDLWCALLKTSAGGKETDWVVYIAKYQDLYNAVWIAHESSKSIADPLLRVDLANIGCDRLMEPGQ